MYTQTTDPDKTTRPLSFLRTDLLAQVLFMALALGGALLIGGCDFVNNGEDSQPPQIDCVAPGAWQLSSTGQAGTKVGPTWSVTDPDNDLSSVTVNWDLTDPQKSITFQNSIGPLTSNMGPGQAGSFVRINPPRIRGRASVEILTLGAKAVLDGTVTVQATDDAGNTNSRTKNIPRQTFNMGDTDLACAGSPGP